MQKRVNLKHVALLLGLLLPTVWCGAISLGSMDGYSHAKALRMEGAVTEMRSPMVMNFAMLVPPVFKKNG